MRSTLVPRSVTRNRRHPSLPEPARRDRTRCRSHNIHDAQRVPPPRARAFFLLSITLFVCCLPQYMGENPSKPSLRLAAVVVEKHTFSKQKNQIYLVPFRGFFLLLQLLYRRDRPDAGQVRRRESSVFVVHFIVQWKVIS